MFYLIDLIRVWKPKILSSIWAAVCNMKFYRFFEYLWRLFCLLLTKQQNGTLIFKNSLNHLKLYVTTALLKRRYHSLRDRSHLARLITSRRSTGTFDTFAFLQCFTSLCTHFIAHIPCVFTFVKAKSKHTLWFCFLQKWPNLIKKASRGLPRHSLLERGID